MRTAIAEHVSWSAALGWRPRRPGSVRNGAALTGRLPVVVHCVPPGKDRTGFWRWPCCMRLAWRERRYFACRIYLYTKTKVGNFEGVYPAPAASASLGVDRRSAPRCSEMPGGTFARVLFRRADPDYLHARRSNKIDQANFGGSRVLSAAGGGLDRPAWAQAHAGCLIDPGDKLVDRLRRFRAVPRMLSTTHA